MINIQKINLSENDRNHLVKIVSKSNRDERSKWYIVTCLVFICSFFFYLYSTTLHFDGGWKVLRILPDWIYGESYILASIKTGNLGFFKTGAAMFCLAIFHAPHIITTALIGYCLGISVYLPFKKKYSVQKLLDIQTNLKDELNTNEMKQYIDGSHLEAANKELARLESSHTEMTNEVNSLKQKIKQKSLYTAEEYTALKTKLYELKEKIFILEDDLISLNTKKESIEKMTSKREFFERGVKVISDAIELERANKGITTSV